MTWNRRHFLSISELSSDEIEYLLNSARGFAQVAQRDIKKVPTLRGKVVVNLFFENSTRTTHSFTLAAMRLSADTINFSINASSVKKGETLSDTARTIEAMGADVVVVRHNSPGVPGLLSGMLKASVVNAGDGCHEHPTQAMSDLYTIREHFGGFEGLQVAIIGDITHSRVARSNIHALQEMGASVTVVGPTTLLPRAVEQLGVQVKTSLDEVLESSDVLYFLRMQQERMARPYIPSIREYTYLYGLTAEREKRMKDQAIIMHPGPINRGVELKALCADSPRSRILDQVENSLAVRMAVLAAVAAGPEAES